MSFDPPGFPPSRPVRANGRRVPGAALALVLLSPVLPAAPESKKESRGISPALDLLPEGSTLKTVSCPRFDKDKNPSALLRAGLMKVVTEDHVSGQNVELRVFNANGTQKLKVHMGAAEYYVPDGILEASEVLTLSGEGFKARGTGAIFLLDARRGFVHGPATTHFTVDLKDKLNTMNANASPLRAATLTGLATLMISTTGAELPDGIAPLAREDLNRLDLQSVSKSQQLLADVAPTKQVITRNEQLAQAAELGFRNFADLIKHPELLAIAVAAPVQDPGPKADPKGLAVSCDGGMYFDVDQGHLVYLKNVVVKEPRFTLNCAGELKIFLEKVAAKPGEDKPGGADAFGDVSNILATGGVRIVRKGAKGGDLVATADTASYDAKSGDMVLRGGFPVIYQGKKVVRALEPGLYVRVYKNGNIYAQPGKWKTEIGDLKNLKKP